MIHAGDYLQTLPWHLNTLHHGPRIHHVLLDLPRYSIDRDKDKHKDKGKDKYKDNKKISQHFTLYHKFRWTSCCSNCAGYVMNECAPSFVLLPPSSYVMIQYKTFSLKHYIVFLKKKASNRPNYFLTRPIKNRKGWLAIAKLKPLVERYSCQPMRRLDTSNNLPVGPSCMWRTWHQCQVQKDEY